MAVFLTGFLLCVGGCETGEPQRGGMDVKLAHDQIEGAFGLKLGDVFETSNGQLNNQISLYLTYTFTPTNVVRKFERFSVAVTHNAHRICNISAIATFRSLSDAQVEIDVLMNILQDKYGREWRPSSGPAADAIKASGMRAIRQGSRSITARTRSTNEGAQLILMYRDERLERIAEKEAIQRLDKSGL